MKRKRNNFENKQNLTTLEMIDQLQPGEKAISIHEPNDMMNYVSYDEIGNLSWGGEPGLELRINRNTLNMKWKIIKNVNVIYLKSEK